MKLLQKISMAQVKIRVVTIDRAGLMEIIPNRSSRTGGTQSLKILVIYDEMYESDVMIKLNVMTDLK